MSSPKRQQGAAAAAAWPLDLDASLAPLLEPDFDATAFVRTVIERGETDSCLGKLAGGLQLADHELAAQVAKRHPALLANVQAARAVESKLLRSNELVESLGKTVHRVRSQLDEPYSQLVRSTTQLERMRQSAELLRHTQRVLFLVKRLRDSGIAPAGSDGGGATASSGAAPRRADLPKAAAALRDLADILDDETIDLDGIEVVDAERPFIHAASVSLRAQAVAMLRQGVAEQSQAQVGAALQVFFNLRELAEKAVGAADEVASSFAKEVGSALDPAIFGPEAAAKLALGGGVLGDLSVPSALIPEKRRGMPPASAAPGWREAVWTRLGRVCEALHAASSRLLTLQRTLGKKRDPISHVLFSSLLPQPPDAAGGGAARGASGPWPHASPAALAQHPLLAAMLAPAAADAAAPAATAAPTAPAATDDEPAAAAAAADEVYGFDVLWRPLLLALQSSLELAASASPFVASTLWSDLPRLLGQLAAVSPRLSAAITPALLPPEAAVSLSAARLLECLPQAQAVFRRELFAALSAAVDAQFAALGAGLHGSAAATPAADEAAAAPEAGRLSLSCAAPDGARAPSLLESPRASRGAKPGAKPGAEPASRLGAALEDEVRRVAALPPLLLLAAPGCAQGVSLFAAEAEAAVRYSDEGDAEYEEAASANGALLAAVQTLRADAHSLGAAGLPPPAEPGSTCAELQAALYGALDKLAPVTAALASPAMPLPEEQRAEAAAALKRQLRRDMINM